MDILDIRKDYPGTDRVISCYWQNSQTQSPDLFLGTGYVNLVLGKHIACQPCHTSLLAFVYVR